MKRTTVIMKYVSEISMVLNISLCALSTGWCLLSVQDHLAGSEYRTGIKYLLLRRERKKERYKTGLFHIVV